MKIDKNLQFISISEFNNLKDNVQLELVLDDDTCEYLFIGFLDHKMIEYVKIKFEDARCVYFGRCKFTEIDIQVISSCPNNILWSVVLNNPNITEKLIRKWFNYFSKYEIVSIQNLLSEDFFRDYQDELDWCYIAKNNIVSQAFAKEFASKLKHQQDIDNFRRGFYKLPALEHHFRLTESDYPISLLK